MIDIFLIVIPPGKIEFRKWSEWTISTNRHSKTYFFPRFGKKTFCSDDITRIPEVPTIKLYISKPLISSSAELVISTSRNELTSEKEIRYKTGKEAGSEKEVARIQST
jgi:hypothetical protein